MALAKLMAAVVLPTPPFWLAINNFRTIVPLRVAKICRIGQWYWVSIIEQLYHSANYFRGWRANRNSSQSLISAYPAQLEVKRGEFNAFNGA
jgi:hypothetical protein